MSQFNINTAIHTRKLDALASIGHTAEELINLVVARVTARIRKEIEIRNVINHLDFTNMMRSLGGYSTLIDNFIGSAPKAKANAAGMATSNAYWIWVIKDEASEDIRERVQMEISKYFSEK